jgi:hypothetical protein
MPVVAVWQEVSLSWSQFRSCRLQKMPFLVIEVQRHGEDLLRRRYCHLQRQEVGGIQLGRKPREVIIRIWQAGNQGCLWGGQPAQYAR